MLDNLTLGANDADPTDTFVSLEALASQTTEEFVAMLDHIGAARGAAAQILAAAGALLEALREAESDSPDVAATKATSLRNAARAAEALLSDLSDPALRERAHDLNERLDEAERASVELTVVAMMTKISASDPSWSWEDGETYARTLEDLANRLGEAIREARSKAAPVPEQTHAAAQGAEGAARALREAAQALVAREAEASALTQARDAELEASKAAAERLSALCENQIGRIVPHLQFADALAQRVGNARRIVVQGEAAGAAGDARALAAAQMTALTEDYAQVRGSLERALVEMTETAAGDEVRDLERADAARRWLAAEAASLARRSEAVAVSQDRLREAETRLAAASDAVLEAAAAVKGFTRLVESLNFASNNAAIAAARSSNKGGPLQFLAQRAQAVARDCAQGLRNSIVASGEIERRLNGLGRGALAEEFESLARNDEAERRAAAKRELALKRQAAARSELARASEALQRAAREGLAAARGAAPREAALAGAARALSEASGPVAGGDLGWAWPLYTTEPERALHRTLLGEEPPAAEDPGEEDEELDGFLL